MNNYLKTKLGKLELNNPVTVASGTFSYEYNEIYDISLLGAIITKTITPQRKIGNPTPRLVETQAGLLNSIGLQNPGINDFLKSEIIKYEHIKCPLIISFSASTIDEFIQMLKTLENYSLLDNSVKISGYEVNVSCPNVENEGLAFGVDAKTVFNLTNKLSQLTQKELIIKLSPNVTDITQIAKAAEDGGATSLSLINTLLGMSIDWQTGVSHIKKGIAGYSGPAIKPVALGCVYRVANKVKIPLLAMGGVSTYKDVNEFIYSGASAVAIRTAQFP
ncbi:MAG: dihydroorotate dehydrogenase, partial [Candidatus Cloacimonetes bacterium]|nr:dihydroorotate dehydrogenase [Candidatus Cloacimonadota bacterium]